MTREKYLLRQNVHISVGWQLGNYQMALKFHDEVLKTHALNQLNTIPEKACAERLISESEKINLIAEIDEKIRKIEGEYKYGKF